MKEINEIWIQRKYTLDKLYHDTERLLCYNLPIRNKIAIWRRVFDTFVLTSLAQDTKIKEIALRSSKSSSLKP